MLEAEGDAGIVGEEGVLGISDDSGIGVVVSDAEVEGAHFVDDVAALKSDGCVAVSVLSGVELTEGESYCDGDGEAEFFIDIK